MTLAVASALGAAAPLALGRLDAGRVVAEPLRELGLRSGRRQAVGPALLLERREVREGVEARAEALALRRRRAGLLGTSALDVGRPVLVRRGAVDDVIIILAFRDTLAPKRDTCTRAIVEDERGDGAGAISSQ